MTDPVPYEPAENIPPVILSETDPDPFEIIELKAYLEPPVTSRHFRIVIEDYNLDDTLYLQLVRTSCTAAGRDVWRQVVPPSGERKRVYDFDLDADRDPLVGRSCAKMILAVSDRTWNPVSPPFCAPQTDDEDQPVTVVAKAMWWIWINRDGTSDGPRLVTDCGL